MCQAHQTVALGISARQNTAPARTAHAIGGEIVGKANAVAGEFVEVLRIDGLDAVAAQVPPYVMTRNH